MRSIDIISEFGNASPTISAFFTFVNIAVSININFGTVSRQSAVGIILPSINAISETLGNRAAAVSSLFGHINIFIILAVKALFCFFIVSKKGRMFRKN